MTLGDFTFYDYGDGGDYSHSENDGILRIENGNNRGRASWFATWAGAVAGGESYRVKMGVKAMEGADVTMVFWNASGDYAGSDQIGSYDDPDEVIGVNAIVTVPAQAVKMRLDLRYWGAEGWAEFVDATVTVAGDPEPELPGVPVLHEIDNPDGSDYFIVRWDASEGADHYELEHSYAGAPPLIHTVENTELQIGDAPIGQ